jgi:hypothetical protein
MRVKEEREDAAANQAASATFFSGMSDFSSKRTSSEGVRDDVLRNKMTVSNSLTRSPFHWYFYGGALSHEDS